MYLTIGRDNDRNLVPVSQVKSGKSELYCPFCGDQLTAKKGNLKAHHFAHSNETCQLSVDAIASSDLPTIDTFDVLDSNEVKYLDRRQKYTHKSIFRWTGMQSAIERLEVMGIIEVERKHSPELTAVVNNLNKIDPHFVDDNFRPSAKLITLFEALSPLANLEKQFQQTKSIASTTINRSYHKYKPSKWGTDLSKLDEAQRYWLDAKHRKISKYQPEIINFYEQRIETINQQTLYLMEFTGIFNGTDRKLIKIGKTGRDVELRLKEVISDLKQIAPDASGKVVSVAKHCGRLEQLAHRAFREHRVPLGTFTEFYSTDCREAVEAEIKKISDTEPYRIPNCVIDLPSMPGRRPKTDNQLLSEYSEVVGQLNSGVGIRATARATSRSVNTVQRVAKALKRKNIGNE